MKAWLSQFDGDDIALSEMLIEQLLYVTADEFHERMTGMLRDLPNQFDAPFGLYAERKVRRRNGIPNQLFKQPRRVKNRKAYGGGPQPVDSTHAGRHEVGSEGILAQFATELTRAQPAVFFNHPGPNRIRQSEIRHFVLITDFIGTGNQASEYLEAAWRVASMKSWHSYGKIRFIVVCHSATHKGREKVTNHRCKPIIIEYQACPTLADFAPYRRHDIRKMCERKGPSYSKANGIPALGYGNTGALIAFAHGIPNNAPRLLFKKSRNWAPLFPARVTSAVQPLDTAEKLQSISERLERLREKKISKLALANGLPSNSDTTLLVLAALKQRPRTVETVSSRTGLTLIDVRDAITRAQIAGWIDGNNKLTTNAYRELEALRDKRVKRTLRYKGERGVYVPESLRAPSQVFS